MKGKLWSLWMLVLLIGTFGAAALAKEGRATHVPLAEYGTATWCTYCKYAHGALKQLYEEGNHEFFYISFVTDKNAKANQHMNNDFNIYGYPTVFFDGGYKVNVGAGSIPSAKAVYDTSLTACEAAAVHDVDLDVEAKWMGNATISTCAVVKNNESRTYDARVRIFITELVSSLGWKDTAGELYTFPFLDYSMNEVISVPAGGAWSLCNVWDGAAAGFPKIDPANIMVIAAVAELTPHQGYAYPPSSNPFTAYYIDDAAGTMPDVLRADSNEMPEAGADIAFHLITTGSQAGRHYVIVGGVSGSNPGIPLPGGVTLPVHWDVFTDIEMTLLNSVLFQNFLGVLDSEGQADALLSFPALPPGTAGAVMTYAFALNNPFNYASNAVDITIVP